MIRIRDALLSVVVVSCLAACAPDETPDGRGHAAVTARLDSLVEPILAFAVNQYRTTAATHDPSGGYPRSTVDGRAWRTVPPGDWTSGFFPGILWQLVDHTRDEQIAMWAHEWTTPLTEIFDGGYSHDLGFQFYCSFGQALRVTGDESYRDPLLEAARRLAERFNPTVGAIKSWDWSDQWAYPVIADNMMNLELLFWGAQNGGDPEWSGLAIRHAHTTIRDHVRADGGSYHVVDYDPSTGEVVGRVTHQGAADTSTWARGHAWLLYGFTMAYRETQIPEFLETANRVANYFVTDLPDDGIPYWDFQAPGIPQAERDASAAAIAASGLLELSTFVTSEDSERYRSVAQRILVSLSAPPYLARGTDSPSVLVGAVGHRPQDSEVGVGLIYADYYFIEALRRHQRMGGSLR